MSHIDTFRPIERNLIRRAEEMVKEATLRSARDGEDVRYAVSLTVVPGAEPGTFVPVMILVVTMASVVLGERIYVNHLTDNLDLVSEDVDAFVNQAMEVMRAQRAEMLSTTTV